ncbi:isopenicillin N synthase family oxygenase [Sphingopyxis sp. USTB-05]|uniref:isopenicillin N synthase family dioxygenase n=1 Tax=Sphingopyxis sp. USTB-05 TaxID=2830667 RepID=UPI002078684C|nr:2-oxoglutarate and iron-dependent oxygenase domain-containing protein [Sphingopyxis sp. USTB-05]USI77597.1 hypothetical protein KEC45_01390 [Sphingopyxis sp. USTB-05]
MDVGAGEKTDGHGAMNAKLMPFSSIPVIDISALRTSDPVARHATAERIGLACEQVGFFYVKNHGIPESVIERAYALSKEFHHSSNQQKSRVHVRNSQGVRGWTPTTADDDDDDPELYRLADADPDYDYLTRPRLFDTLDLAGEIAEDDPDYLAGDILLVPNQWPDWIPGFRDGVMEYYDAVKEIGDLLFRAFELRLDLPNGFFAGMTTKTASQLRLLHYPENDLPMDNQHLGIGVHSDFECFTILNQRSAGLQVMNAADEWVAAPPIDGTFIVNIGDMLEALTNGRFKATQHRVVNQGKERFSLPLFFATNYDTVIEPLPQFVSADQPARYGSIIAGEHLAGFMIEGTKHLRKKVVNGELQINFKIHSTNPFQRKAVN